MMHPILYCTIVHTDGKGNFFEAYHTNKTPK